MHKHTRMEGRGRKRQRKFLFLNFSYLALKYNFLLRISPWCGRPPGSPPPPPHLPLGEDHTLHPSTGVRGSRGGSLASPPQQLCFPGSSGPGDSRRLSSRLCHWGQEIEGPSQPPVTVKGCGLNAGKHMVTHTCIHTYLHWAYTQAHTFLERHPSAVMAPLSVRWKDAGTGVEPNLLCHRLGHTPRLWSSCGWESVGGAPRDLALVRVGTG